MFLPSSHNNLSHVNNKESFVNPGFYYFSKDRLSKELYRLRFEVQMFCKVLMHTFYLGVSFFFLNTLHLLLLSSTVLSNDHWVSKLHDQDSWQTMIGNFFSSVQILILVKKNLDLSSSSECFDADAPLPHPLLRSPLRLLQALSPVAQGGGVSWL